MDFSSISGIRHFADGVQVPTNPNNDLGQDEFLRLMITQLQNQDPFEPMENGQFLGQMAQFSTVSGIRDLQTSFESTGQALNSSQALQAASLVDRMALVESDRAAFDGENPVTGVIDLPPNAMSVQIAIRDEAGALVRRIPAAVGADGRATFSWDGHAENGSLRPAASYRFEAEVDIAGRTEVAPVNIWARIDSVSLGSVSGGGVTINLAGIGPVALGLAREFS